MNDIPDYLNETEESIRRRMLDALPSDLDKTEGSYIWDAIAPAAIEFYFLAIMAQDLLFKGFASTAASQVAGFRSAYLKMRAEEHGVFQRAAVKASKTNGAKFTGSPGTIIQSGTKIATPADSATNTPSVEFVTTNDCVLDAQGVGYADIEAVEGGISGNVAAGAISILVSSIAGISSVTNPEPITGGLDIEEDSSLLARYYQRVRNPSSSGNRADYIAWALEVPGVGAVSVIPVRDGPGTVSVAILNSNMEPADQALIDATQNYIAPPWVIEKEAETMSLGALGVSIDTTLEDDSYDAVKMVYNSTGNGTITQILDSTILPQLGIWQARVLVKADATTGTTNLLQIGVWNVSAGTWCLDRPFGTTDAVITLKGTDLSQSFQTKNVEFYWNGQDHIELRISRLTTDGTTTVWIDKVTFRSTFSKDTGDGKAPIGARVTVEAATAVMINISANLVLLQGYNANSVKSAVTENIRVYIKSLAFASDNDVRYVRIGEAILNTPGVYDFTNLLVNGGGVNVPIGPQEVAILGVVNLSV